MVQDVGKVAHTVAAGEARILAGEEAVGHVEDGSKLGERNWDGSWSWIREQERGRHAEA